MTLQLVLPNQPAADDPSDSNYSCDNLLSSVYDSYSPPTDVSGIHFRRSRPVSRAGSVLESKSPGFINTRLVNYNRGLSYQNSVRSQAHPEPENIPPPSSDEEKSKTTRCTLTARFCFERNVIRFFP